MGKNGVLWYNIKEMYYILPLNKQEGNMAMEG